VIGFENPKTKGPALFSFISEHASAVNDSLNLSRQNYNMTCLYFRLYIKDFLSCKFILIFQLRCHYFEATQKEPAHFLLVQINHTDRAGGNYESSEAAVAKMIMGLYQVK
jgi:hypothetical protein